MKRVRRNQDAVSRRDFVKAAAVGAGAACLTAFGAEETKAEGRPARWDTEADVVVIGAGATGLPAAIQAAEAGASVILIDANTDVGGHAIVSGGNVALGGGTSKQKKYGIVDSPDLLFSDLTDWSVVERNGFPDYRYNDKEVIRAFADESANTYEWLVAHGVIFVDKTPDTLGGNACGNSAPREHHAAAMTWPLVQTGAPLPAGPCGDFFLRCRADPPAGSIGEETRRANPPAAQNDENCPREFKCRKGARNFGN